jgi:hypothetical protein
MYAVTCVRKRLTELIEKIRHESEELTREKIKLAKTPPQFASFQAKIRKGRHENYPLYVKYKLLEQDKRLIGLKAVEKMLPVYQKILDTLLDIRSHVTHQENVDLTYSHLSLIFAYTDLVIEPFLHASRHWQWTDVDIKTLTRHPLHPPRSWMKTILKNFTMRQQKQKSPVIRKKVRFTLPPQMM